MKSLQVDIVVSSAPLMQFSALYKGNVTVKLGELHLFINSLNSDLLHGFNTRILQFYPASSLK